MDVDDRLARLAMLELRASGRLRRRRGCASTWDWLATLSWTRASGRRDELALVAGREGELEAALDRIWPAWRHVDERLRGAGLPRTIDGWRRLQELDRAAGLPELPTRLNRRTALAAVAPHAKAALTRARASALGGAEVVRDGAVRLRPPAGLVLRRGERRLDVDDVVALLGEVSLPERALRDGTVLEGPLRGVLLVENLGTFRDVPAPAGVAVAHVPGWDTATVRLWLRSVPGVPVVHFGDLDPNGLRILRHLRIERPDCAWLVPSWWGEHVALRGRRCRWPTGLVDGDTPELVRALARDGVALEQEVIALDPRLPASLEAALGGRPSASQP